MKKYVISSMYFDPGQKELTWEEAENLAYWEIFCYGLAMQGVCGSAWQAVATNWGFPTWVYYFN